MDYTKPIIPKIDCLPLFINIPCMSLNNKVQNFAIGCLLSMFVGKKFLESAEFYFVMLVIYEGLCSSEIELWTWELVLTPMGTTLGLQFQLINTGWK